MWEGEAIEEHRKDGRILSTLSETEKRCKTGSKDKRYVKYSVIGDVEAAEGLTKMRVAKKAEYLSTERCWALHKRE